MIKNHHSNGKTITAEEKQGDKMPRKQRDKQTL